MKKRIFAALMSLAMAASLLSTAVAAPITPEDPENPNQYVITDALQNFKATDDLWIGTLADWKAEGKAVGSTGTVFENGEAIHEDDIIITNGKVGAVLAVGTRNPWGYPAGSVLDVGAVENWVGDRDTVWSVEVLVNGWDFWAPDNCGKVTFDVVKYNFDPAVKAESEDGQWAVKVSRIYDDTDANGVTFNVDTYYGISPDANYIMMFDKLANTSGKDTHKVSNRFALTNKGDDGGAMYNGKALTAIGTYGATDKNVYSTSYVLPGQNISNLGVAHAWGKTGGSVGYKELRAGDGGKQAYLKDEVVTFDEYIIVSNEPTTEAVSDFMIDYKDATPMTVTGTAKDAAGNALANPVIVVEKAGSSYAWFMGEADGSFSFQLPEGDDFTAYIEQNGYAKGTPVAITDAALELATGAAKVDVTFNLKDQNGEPVYGKLELFVPDGDGWESAYPTVRFCGDSVYQAEEEGVIHAQIEPGQYKAVVFGEGYWFYSDPVEVIANTADGDQDVVVNMVYDAPEGWVSGDLHHHANKNDAFADPEDAIPSLKASGLDVGFITDHDFTVNNAKAYELAKKYDLFGFIPSEEISCSWAHFNVIPQDPASWEYFLDENSENHVMNQFEKLPVFVQQTIDKGASITANHPWYSYGLYYSMDAEKVPGGYTDEYGNIEINACSSDAENLETILSATDMWTSYQDGTSVYNDINGNPVITEKAHYIIGGSDTHDVLYPGFAGDIGLGKYNNTRANYTAEGNPYSDSIGYAVYASGKVRTFAYVGDTTGTDVTANGLAFANAVVNGHSYTTYGPILTLDQIPGNEYDVDGTFALTVGVESLANVKDIVVLTKNSADSYAGLGTSAYTEGQIQCDADLSTFDVNAKTGEFTIEVDVARGQQDWVAVLVVDENGNYAITNPYWLTGTGDYSDVDDGHWAYASVMDVAEKGLMNGVGDGSVFAPATELTRGMAATVLYRVSGAEGGNAAEAAATFGDVAADKWYAEAIDWASDNKIAQGDGTTFRPNDTITRQDMVTMLYRYAEATGADVSAAADLAAYTDAGDVASYAEAAMKWAVGAGIINGRTDTTLVPGGALNRAEFATIISRYTK